MKRALLVAAICCNASLTCAQTALRMQPVLKSDPCVDADPDDLASCGMDAYADHNYAAARRAWGIAARHDYQAAAWLGQMYQQGRGGPKDYVQAYKWFDVAAAVHARAIDHELPAADPTSRDSNGAEIGYRDAVAKKMTAVQIASAQKLSRDWQKASLPAASGKPARIRR